MVRLCVVIGTFFDQNELFCYISFASCSSVMPKNSRLIATRKIHFTIILDALYILCCTRDRELSTVIWSDITEIICSKAKMQNADLMIEFDGQSMTYGDYIRENRIRLRDHFHNHICLNYAKQTRRSTGLFLQMFLGKVRMHGLISKEDMLKCKLDCKLKQDVYTTFFQSKFQTYITFKNKKAEETLPSTDEEILPCCSSEWQLSSAVDMSDGDADAFAKSLWRYV